MLLSIFSYLCVIGGVLLFTLYIESQYGVVMLAFLILMPLFSALITLYGRKKIRLSFVVPSMANKSHKVVLSTRTEKITLLPLPFLRYSIYPDEHFSTSVTDVQLALGSKEKSDKQHTLFPTICGNAKVYLVQPRLTGYLGFLNCALDMKTEAELMILPEIPELSAGNKLFYAITNSGQVSEDEDENTATNLYGINTIAGYSHREYQPGDPLKRINWKLSSKKDNLMVRLDESLSITKTSVMLDFQRAQGFEENRESFLMEQCVTEGALGLLAHCAEQRFGCNFYYYSNQGWAETQIDTREQVDQLSVSVLEHGFGEIPERVPTAFSQNSKNGIFLIFTATPDAALLTAASALNGTVHIVVPLGTVIPQGAEGVHFWIVTADYRIVSASSSENRGDDE